MSDLINRQAAIDAFHTWFRDGFDEDRWWNSTHVLAAIEGLPSAQLERKTGKWTEKHHAYSDEESVIEEWQSCCCSECGRYDTRPYLYYFSEPNFCSYCGADMKGDKNETD